MRVQTTYVSGVEINAVLIKVMENNAQKISAT